MVMDCKGDPAKEFDPAGKFVFGYVHHGLYPLGEVVARGGAWSKFTHCYRAVCSLAFYALSWRQLVLRHPAAAATGVPPHP